VIQRLQVSWTTVVLLVVLIACADGFWVTSVQGAVGATAESQTPFVHWARDSALMLTPFLLAVLAALALTRRWLGRGRSENVQLAVAALFTVLITTCVGVAQLAATAARDYKIQVNGIGVTHSLHGTPVIATGDTTIVLASTGGCTEVCAARHQTFVTHVRAAEYASVLMLISNIVLVVWTLALRGGRLWARRPRLELADLRAGGSNVRARERLQLG
jgi:hypothetical protein